MKRKLLIALTVILVIAFAVPAFADLAGLTDKQKQEINGLNSQIVELRKQMVDKYVDAGQITADQSKAIKDRMDQVEKYRQDNNILPGSGFGRGNCGGFGGGCGMGGRGGAGAWGGPGASGTANTNLQ